MDRRLAAAAVSGRRPAFHVTAWAIGALLAACPAFSAATPQRAMVGYYPSWMCGSPLLPKCDAAANLTQTPAAYTHVLLAFAKPDFVWNGANWNGSGLEFRGKTPAEIKPAIATLRKRGVRVLLAVGGQKYVTWAPLAAEAAKPGPITEALAAAISDLGIDGLDVDYEAEGAGPPQIAEYANAVRAMHRAVTKAGTDKVLTLAAWSTGADCTPATGLAPCGGRSTVWEGRAGRERLLFRDRAVLDRLTMINVMAYDAGTDQYDPVKAYALYRTLVPSRVTVNMGFETAPEGWGNGKLVANDADAKCPGSVVAADQFATPVHRPYSIEHSLRSGPLASRVNAHDGAMLWHVLKDQDLPRCGAKNAVSPYVFELKARALLDGRQSTRAPAFGGSHER